VSTNVMTESIKKRALPNLGWDYEAKRGRGGGARFVKTGNAVLRLGVAMASNYGQSPIGYKGKDRN
jgi:hypothetical protein